MRMENEVRHERRRGASLEEEGDIFAFRILDGAAMTSLEMIQEDDKV